MIVKLGRPTATAVKDSVVVPLPSWPLPLYPQQYAQPPERAHMCPVVTGLPPPPAVIAVAFVRLETVTGIDESVVVPSPSWPWLLSPQHFAVPPDSNAHVEDCPTAMAVAFVRLDTATGVHDGVVVPSPSWPRPLKPQHFAVPPDRAHEWYN